MYVLDLTDLIPRYTVDPLTVDVRMTSLILPLKRMFHVENVEPAATTPPPMLSNPMNC